MSLGVNVSIPVDTASPALQKLQRNLTAQRLGPIAGRAAVNLFRAHFFERDKIPNQLDGVRTHFWANAARATHFDVDAGGAIVSVNEVGVRQRLQGGTIKPNSGKFLTIPAAPEAYGHRAREFNDLRFAILGAGGPALLRNASSKLKRSRKTGRITGFTEQAEKVMYWLRRSVTQKADPTVLPPRDVFASTVSDAIKSFLSRLVSRQEDTP